MRSAALLSSQADVERRSAGSVVLLRPARSRQALARKHFDRSSAAILGAAVPLRDRHRGMERHDRAALVCRFGSAARSLGRARRSALSGRSERAPALGAPLALCCAGKGRQAKRRRWSWRVPRRALHDASGAKSKDGQLTSVERRESAWDEGGCGARRGSRSTRPARVCAHEDDHRPRRCSYILYGHLRRS